MADQRNGISWCDETWSPTRGCQRVSEGCRHCWAERMAARLRHTHYAGLIRPDKALWTGRARFVPEMLERPLRWRKPRRIAVSLMGDVFHDDITNEQIAAVFGVMAATPQHTYLVLTKRPQRMVECSKWLEKETERRVYYNPADPCVFEAGVAMNRVVEWPLSNVFVGISAENQQTLEERWQYLAQVPAAVRWISLEPLLAGVDLSKQTRDPYDCITVDWVVLGTESGPNRRYCETRHIQNVVAQCDGVCPVHVKQIHLGGAAVELACCKPRLSKDPREWPEDIRRREWPEVSNA